MKSYAQFWPYYLGEHHHAPTRCLHSLGTLVGLVCLFVVVPATRNLFWGVAGLTFGYALAWFSHLAIERNKPATLDHPLWSFYADMEMLALVVTGELGHEVAAQASGIEVPVPTPGRRLLRRGIRVLLWSWLGLLAALDLAGHLHFSLP